MHGLHALVVIYLLDMPARQRKILCQELEKDNWIKLGTSDMIWRVAFRMQVKRMGATRTIQSSLHRAKEASGVREVEYVVQMDVKEVVVAVV